MSAASDYAERLNLAETVARIERSQQEMRKFIEEQQKLAAERDKLHAEREKFAFEQQKLNAETIKLARDTRLAPWIVAGGVAGGVLTAATLLMRALGVLS